MTPSDPLHSFDVVSSSPCDHRHERFWKQGWADAVLSHIKNCPCNPGGRSIFCIHALYFNREVTPSQYLESLGCSQTTIRIFQVTQIVAALLDTTRRVVEKWNVNPGNDSNLEESRGILLEDRGRILSLRLKSTDKKQVFLLIEETRKRLALYPPRDGDDFLQQYWEPVRLFNTRLQLGLREKILRETTNR